VPRAFQDKDFGLVTLGYVIMRAALIVLWLRAARGHEEGRSCALRYALGIAVWAERVRSTAWHPHHIAERYGLFTIIVLGESILAATMAIQSGLDRQVNPAALLSVAFGGMVIVFAMWWH
jgi:low temperature requirement protein LtrA